MVHPGDEGPAWSYYTGACCRRPTKDKICLLVAFFFPSHPPIGDEYVLTSLGDGPPQFSVKDNA